MPLSLCRLLAADNRCASGIRAAFPEHVPLFKPSGLQTAISGGASGAMTGAALGSIVPGLGTGLGAAIGGGLGLLGSLF